jgi:hypothetical protein
MITQTDKMGRNLTLIKKALTNLGLHGEAALAAFTDAAQADLNARFPDQKEFIAEHHVMNEEGEQRLLEAIKQSVLHQASQDSASGTPSATFMETLRSLGDDYTPALYQAMVGHMTAAKTGGNSSGDAHDQAAQAIVEQMMSAGKIPAAIGRAAEWVHVKDTKPEMIR